MNSLEFYLAQLCGCKRDVTRVAGKVSGLTDCVFTGLCEALPEAKGKGSGVQESYSKANRGMGNVVAIFLVVAVMVAAIGSGNAMKTSTAIFFDISDTIIQNNTIRIDTIVGTPTQYIFYNENNDVDSTVFFNANDGTRRIEYNNHPQRIWSKTFRRGRLVHILFSINIDEAIRGDTIEISFFESGKPSGVVTLERDSMLPYPQLRTYFFENGQIEMQGVVDSYSVWAMPVGLWKIFDISGALIETFFSHPDEEGKDYIIVEEFSEGTLISRKKYNNYIQRESDPVLKEILYLKDD